MTTYATLNAKINELQRVMLELNYQLGGNAAIIAIMDAAIENNAAITAHLILTHWAKCFNEAQLEAVEQVRDAVDKILAIEAADPGVAAWIVQNGPDIIAASEDAIKMLQELIMSKTMKEKEHATLQ